MINVIFWTGIEALEHRANAETQKYIGGSNLRYNLVRIAINKVSYYQGVSD